MDGTLIRAVECQTAVGTRSCQDIGNLLAVNVGSVRLADGDVGTADGSRHIGCHVAGNDDRGRRPTVADADGVVGDGALVNADFRDVRRAERLALNGQRLTIISVGHVVAVGCEGVGDAALLDIHGLCLCGKSQSGCDDG